METLLPVKAIGNRLCLCCHRWIRIRDWSDQRYILVRRLPANIATACQLPPPPAGYTSNGITGTNGKTTTKELISAVLSQSHNILYTLGNLNNHIGVPSTLLRLKAEHDLAVIEMGANHPGEIKFLSEIVEPDCGIITNVAKPIWKLRSFEGVIKPKKT